MPRTGVGGVFRGRYIQVKQTFAPQLDSIVDDYDAMQEASQYSDFGDLPTDERQSLITRSIAAVHQISGTTSTYSGEIARIIEANPALHKHMSSVIGVVKALRHNLTAGYLQTFTELVHAAVYADFMEMATQLLDSGYKDAAAVICGSTLENHLRELCKKHGIATEVNGRPKKADKMNAELAKVTAYSALDQKSVTAWLGLRNKAAHGEYAAYDAKQVDLLISGVEQFAARTLA